VTFRRFRFILQPTTALIRCKIRYLRVQLFRFSSVFELSLPLRACVDAVLRVVVFSCHKLSTAISLSRREHANACRSMLAVEWFVLYSYCDCRVVADCRPGMMSAVN